MPGGGRKTHHQGTDALWKMQVAIFLAAARSINTCLSVGIFAFYVFLSSTNLKKKTYLYKTYKI